MFAVLLWRSTSGCEHREAVSAAFQQQQQQQWVTSTGADLSVICSLLFITGKNAELLSVTVNLGVL